MTTIISPSGQKNNEFATWDITNKYRAGDLVVNTGSIYEANDDIPASTAWAIGATGATWTEVLSAGGGGGLGDLTAMGNIIYATDGSGPTGFVNYDNGILANGGFSHALVMGTRNDMNAMISVHTVSGTETTWKFDTDGNLTLPTNTSSINYANGAPYGGGGGGTTLPDGTSPFQILAWQYDGVTPSWQIGPNPVYWNLPVNQTDAAYVTAVNAVGQGLQEGSRYYNTTNEVLRVYDGGAWQDAGSGATPTTVAALGTKPQGFRAFVTDSQTPASAGFGSPVTGGGSNKTPVWSNGIGWFIG
jgi:hypothetical protein